MEKIVPLQQSRTIDYSQEKVNHFWLGNGSSQKSLLSPAPLEVLSAFLQKWESKAEVVCIASSELASPVVVKWCLTLAGKGGRIYFLTAKRPSDAAQLGGSSLLRFDLPLLGSFVVVNPHHESAGLFLDHSLTDVELANGRNTALEMDSSQSMDAYEFFAYHFWSSAKSEILDRSAKPLPCKTVGFSVQKPKDKVGDCAALFGENAVSHAAFPSSHWNLEGLGGATLVTDFQLQQVEKIGGANKLYANAEAGRLHCICNEKVGYLFANAGFGKGDIHYALSLNADQRRKFVALIEGGAAQADCSFVSVAARQALIGRKIRPLGTVHDQVISEKAIRSLTVSANSFLSLGELESLEPALEDDGVSCKVKYEWSILPFFLPKGAAEDPLYQKWKDKQANFLQRIGETQKVIDKAEEKSKGIGGSLLRFLTRTIVGKSQKWEELRKQLSEFGEVELQRLSPGERKKIVEQFNTIQKEAANTVLELDQKVEEAKQQEDWESKRKVLVDEVSNLENQLAASAEGILQKESSFVSEQEVLRERFEAWLKAQNIVEEDLPKHRSKWEQASGKKNRDKNPKEAEEAKVALSELDQLEPSVMKRRHAGDMKDLQQAKQQLEVRLQKKKSDLEKMGDQFKPSGQAGGGSMLDGLQGKGGGGSPINFRAFLDEFPEDLPLAGTLYSAAGKRYLAISYWQEEEKGRKEADRLKAILCAFN